MGKSAVKLQWADFYLYIVYPIACISIEPTVLILTQLFHLLTRLTKLHVSAKCTTF